MTRANKSYLMKVQIVKWLISNSKSSLNSRLFSTISRFTKGTTNLSRLKCMQWLGNARKLSSLTKWLLSGVEKSRKKLLKNAMLQLTHQKSEMSLVAKVSILRPLKILKKRQLVSFKVLLHRRVNKLLTTITESSSFGMMPFYRKLLTNCMNLATKLILRNHLNASMDSDPTKEIVLSNGIAAVKNGPVMFVTTILRVLPSVPQSPPTIAIFG